ncbi:Uncharacterised protein [Turicibacter sanguinis]|nr:Uncharacterised protein [Turicibacter sanguinis]
MDQKLTTLINVLSELRTASINSTPENIKTTMDKYDMLFLGEKFNCIYSIELAHSLKNFFNVNISHDELLTLIPIACSNLNMKFEELIALGNPSTHCYSITLF